MKKLVGMLFLLGIMLAVSFSALAIPILPVIEEAIIEIVDPDTGEVIRTDNYADILNALVTVSGDVSSFVYGSGVILTDGDPNDYYKVNFNLAVDTDPWYVWNVNLFNSSTKDIRVHTETFSGTFSEPVGKYTEVSSQIGGLLQDFSGDGIRIEPVNQSHIAVTKLFSDSHPSVNLGVDVGNALEITDSGQIVEGDPSEIGVLFPGMMYTYSSSVDPKPGPDPFPDSLWTGFRTTVSFNVTPWDSANFNGRVDIVPTSAPNSATPEPSTIFLLGSGMLGIMLLAWRRKRHK